MKKFIGVVALLVLTGFMAMPTLAAELQVRGFFENVLPHIDHNGVVKLIFTLVRLAPCVAHSPHGHTSPDQSLQAPSVSCGNY